jgi:glycosyltransferase involved in cell wall biosynthesis
LEPKLPIRVLHSFDSLNPGGIETWLLNILRQRSQRLQFDFILNTSRGTYEEEARSYGCRIYYRPSATRLGKRLEVTGLAPRSRCLTQTLQLNRYDVFHIHGEEFLGDALRESAASGVPVRVAHCHASQLARGKKNIEMAFRWLRFRTLDRSRILKYSTRIAACSNTAGRFLVGAHWDSDRRCKALYCGIPLNQYRAASSRWTRQEFRQLHQIPQHAVVIGHIGSMGPTPVKNHSFLLQVFAELAKRNESYHLFLAGDGPLRSALEARVKELGLEKRVSLPGFCREVPALLVHGFDLLVFPSTMEGLGLVIVEAAAAGLFTVCSDIIPDEVTATLLDRVLPLPLSLAPSVWADRIEQSVNRRISPREGIPIVEKTPFSIASSLKSLLETYTGEPSLAPAA